MPPNATQPHISYCPATRSPGFSFGRKSYGVPHALQKPFSRDTISQSPPHLPHVLRAVPVYSYAWPHLVHFSFVSGVSHALPSALTPVQYRLLSGTFASAISDSIGSAFGTSGIWTSPRPSRRVDDSREGFEVRRDPRWLLPESCVEPERALPVRADPVRVEALCGVGPVSWVVGSPPAGCMPQTSQKPSTIWPV